jgi:hypothetical protein
MDHSELLVNMLALFLSSSPGKDKGEKPVKGLETLVKAALTPSFIRRLVSWWKDRKGDRSESYNLLCKAFKIKSAYDYTVAYRKCCQWSREYAKNWLAMELDACICPMPSPATPLYYAGQLFHLIGYTMIFNMLEFPVTAVPITTVQADEQVYESSETGNVTPLMKEIMQGSVGLPIGV